MGYYQQNNTVLTFNEITNADEILFNHYISRKENLQRLTGELPRGQFYIAENTAAHDLNKTRWKIREMIKNFEELGIITRVFKPEKGSKNPSIFQYNSAIENQHDTRQDTQHDVQHDKSFNTNGLARMNQHDVQHEARQENQQSKKESSNKKIYKEVIHHLNEQAGKNYKPDTSETQNLINARLCEGFTQQDFFRVIDCKTSEWKGTDWERYLRPSTLFGPKFESYLNSTSPNQTKRYKEL